MRLMLCALVAAALAACGGSTSLTSVRATAPTSTPPTTLRPVTKVNPCVVPDGMVVPTFDPLTASDAVLRAHDFPSRPRPGEPGETMAGWEQYARWYLAGDVYRCGTPREIPQSGTCYPPPPPPGFDYVDNGCRAVRVAARSAAP
jgi:hypothetical protein